MKENSGVENEEDKCNILKESAAKKYWLIIQQSTNSDVYKIKNTDKKIIVCDCSLQFNFGLQ